MLRPSYAIPELPPAGVDFETPVLLKALAQAHRYVAELKGCSKSIPNQAILINTLVLQEAKASSEVESYITTQDALFQADLHLPEGLSPEVKEVTRYREALMLGFQRMKAQKGMISNGTLIELFQLLKNSGGAFRSTSGTVLNNERGGATVFVPPQDPQLIIHLMDALEQFVNDEALCSLDPLIKMALIHHQFESIHPFSDGNGRIGRIQCVLYMVQARLLDAPILYLSRYLNARKDDYYRLLQGVRNQQGAACAWQAWILFILEGVANTAQQTVVLIEAMRDLMASTKQRMRDELPKLYSQDLLNNLFRHPYTRIELVERDLKVTRQTAAKYLRELVKIGLIQEQSQGKHIYFINVPLVNLLTQEEQ